MRPALSDAELEAILDGERLLECVEVANRLSLKQSTVQNLCLRGKMRATKINRIWRISRTELRRYILEGPYKGE